MRKLDNKAWNAGYDAYFDYTDRKDNPYEYDSEEYDLWHDGWDDADSDCDDE